MIGRFVYSVKSLLETKRFTKMVTRYARMRPTLGSQKASTTNDYENEENTERQNGTGNATGDNDLLMQMNPTRYLSKLSPPGFQGGPSRQYNSLPIIGFDWEF